MRKREGCLCHHSKTYNHLLSKYLKSEEEKKHKKRIWTGNKWYEESGVKGLCSSVESWSVSYVNYLQVLVTESERCQKKNWDFVIVITIQSRPTFARLKKCVSQWQLTRSGAGNFWQFCANKEWGCIRIWFLDDWQMCCAQFLVIPIQSSEISQIWFGFGQREEIKR